MASAQNKNIAIVADWIYGGGAEKVLEQLHKMYPDAPIYASYCSDEWQKKLDNKVVTGYLQNWPFNKLRKFLPLLRQWWFANLNLQEFDLVISATGNGEAKFAKTRPNATHICYCHTPPHFYWRKYKDYMKNPGFGAFDFLARIGLFLFVKPLRKRDYNAAQKVDFFIGNSSHIAGDIKKYYQREAVAIFPPVDTARFAKIKRTTSDKTRYLAWGRHVPDKRLDLAVIACSNMGLDLTVVGKGPETQNLKKLAGPSVNFSSALSDDELDQIIANCDAFIFTSLEDFGIAPVEAMAAGLPVIAFSQGGSKDYVVPGKTGVFFDQQTVESLEKTLETFDHKKFNSAEIKKFAINFSIDQFTKNFGAFVDSKLSKRK